MASVLITGGGGYIGSTACAWLLDKGHKVFVIDDFSTGKKELVLTDNFVQARIGDIKQMESLLKYRKFDCVMHFAASTIVSESFEKPQEYYENNVNQTDILLNLLIKSEVKKFIFSSSCTIFGNSEASLIDENQEKKPISPYGESKLTSELQIKKLSAIMNFECIVLRYFNAAGSEPGFRTGEWHTKETRLIPLAIKALREQNIFSINGEDYPTPDKTCIRDYVHVWDIAQAHELAMNRLLSQKVGFEDYNLGSEKGYSVREILKCIEKLTGKKLQTQVVPRRNGDPARLVASKQKAEKVLGFKPQFSDLDTIILTALEWDRKLNKNN